MEKEKRKKKGEGRGRNRGRRGGKEKKGTVRWTDGMKEVEYRRGGEGKGEKGKMST